MQNSVSTQLEVIAFPNLQQLTEGFTGRSQIFSEINHWLQQKDQRFFILAGEPGVGKSAIAAHLIQTRKDIFAYHFCQADDANTLKPGQILRSLAAQLMHSSPYYGEALLNTVKPSRLSGEVNINIEQEISSTIQRVKVNNFNKSDIENELDILIRAPLVALPQLYKQQEKLCPILAVIVIDGLDMAVSSDEAAQDDEDIVTLLASLSEAENLPSWVRFILTSRPDRRVLREFEPLQPYPLQAAAAQDADAQAKAVVLPNRLYKLDELSDENQADLRQYIQQRVEQSPFQPLLATAQMSEQALVEALTEQAQGNFRYVRCVLDDLEAGTQTPGAKRSLSHLAGLPESLKQIYAKEWFATASGEECKSILKAIANAETFLTEDEVVSQTGLRPRLVRQALWGLRQFLDVGIQPVPENPEDGEANLETVETFAIFHPSLREYLLPCNLE